MSVDYLQLATACVLDAKRGNYDLLGDASARALNTAAWQDLQLAIDRSIECGQLDVAGTQCVLLPLAA